MVMSSFIKTIKKIKWMIIPVMSQIISLILYKKKYVLHPYQLLKASTIQEEVKQIVFDINTLLSNHTLRDFAIYYPNDDYYRHLCRILDQFGFAYNKRNTC